MVLQNKSDNSTVHHALQSCQIRMVLQNKSDNSNGHALKWSNFRLNLVFWRCLSEKRTHYRENVLGNKNFRENLLIFASFSLFAKMEKTFSFQPYCGTNDTACIFNFFCIPSLFCMYMIFTFRSCSKIILCMRCQLHRMHFKTFEYLREFEFIFEKALAP
jgi:hypothetical protein